MSSNVEQLVPTETRKSGWGGARPNSGRKPGSLNKTNSWRETARENIAKAVEDGTDPLSYLLSVVNNESLHRAERVQAAAILMPYCYPRLAMVQVSQPPPANAVITFNFKPLRSAGREIEGFAEDEAKQLEATAEELGLRVVREGDQC